MIEENGLSRVYLGVHWVFDAFMLDDQERPNLTAKQDGLYIGGVPLGLQIAEDIFDASGLKAPVPKKSTVAPRP
jgi:vanadium chloroperoxidase